MGEMVQLERAEQLRHKHEQKRMEREEERHYAQLWEENRRQKIEREIQDKQRQKALTHDMISTLDDQTALKREQQAAAQRVKEEQHQLLVSCL